MTMTDERDTAAPELAPKRARLPRTLAVLTATIVLINAQIYNVIPLFSTLSKQWDVSAAQLTWLSSSIAMGYTAGFVLLGPLTDRVDRRAMLVYGTAATAVATLAVAAAGGLEIGVALRGLQGFTAAVFAPAAFVNIASTVPPRRRALALSTVVSGALAAAVFGQATGQLLNQAMGWRSVYIGSAIALAVAAVALRVLLIGDPAAPDRRGLRETYLALPRLLVRRDLAPLYAVTLTALGGFVAVYTALQITGGISNGQLLVLRVAVLPAIVAVPLVATWLSRFASHHRAAAATLVSAIAAAAVALLQPGEVGLVFLLLAYTLGVSAAAPAINETIAARSGAQRGSALSLFTAMLMVGASVTPPLVGAAAASGLGGIFTGIAVVVAIAAAATWWTGARHGAAQVEAA